MRNCEVGHSRKLREHGVQAKWGDTPENWENRGGRCGGILQETGKMTAGRSGGILQEKSENGVRADWGDTPGNTQNDGGGGGGEVQEKCGKMDCGRSGGDTLENSGKMEIWENVLRAEWGDT